MTNWRRTSGWPTSSAHEMIRLGRTPVAEEVEAAVPLGSTDMGNVTQVMPGIHPVVGVDAGGASVHQPAFAAAAAGPSADKAVVEGAIMLARTVVSLAETPAERDRVLELRRPERGASMRLADTADGWLAAHYDDAGRRGAGTSTPTRSWAGRSSPPPSSSRRSSPTPASTRRCCPAAPA